jgi:hypothetical protein
MATMENIDNFYWAIAWFCGVFVGLLVPGLVVFFYWIWKAEYGPEG